MAKEFAKKFYRSKKWKVCREQIFNKYFGICAECGKPGEEVHHIEPLTPLNIDNADITLGEDNLILLCKECHFKKHKDINNFINLKSNRKSVKNGIYFDEDGNLRQTKVYIVYGSPGAGKTTYVRRNKQIGDLVVDLDLIKQAISMEGKTEATDNLLGIAIGIRDYIYSVIEKKEYDCKNVWVIASLPKKIDRESLSKKLEGELIFIDTNINECIDRVNNDSERKNKELQLKIIEKWFANYEE